MKRLIKKSEIYDGFNYGNNYFEVYKNPTNQEIEEVRKSDSRNDIRGVVYDDGTMYIWPGAIVHSNINMKIQNTISVNDTLRFSYENNNWMFDAHDNFTLEEMKQKILQNTDKLEQIGSLNTLIEIAFVSDYDTSVLTCEQGINYLDELA